MAEKKNILVLEDDEGILSLERKVLERAGYAVTALSSPASARMSIDKRCPDLLVLDYKLSETQTGLEFYRSLREAGHDISAILVTGFSDEKRLIEALRAGIRDVLPKTGEYLDFLPMAAQRVLNQVETERKLAVSEALREKEARFVAMFEQAAVGMTQISLDYLFERANEKMCEILGYSLDELIGRPFTDFTHPDDRELHVPLVRQLLAGEIRHASFEKRYYCKAGRLIWARVTTSLVRDAHDRPMYFVSVVEDITQRKKSEEELKAAKEQAESANRAKDKFLAVLSHELRTPLTPVLMTLTALESDPRGAAAEDVSMMRRNVELEARLIDDLLDLSRVMSGKMTMHFQVVHLHGVIRHAVETCAAAITEKNLRLSQQLAVANDAIIGDPGRLQQVIWNLLNNAIKFTAAGGEIAIETRGNDGHITITVQDTGVGIPDEAMDRIFNAFEQADDGSNRRFGGLGLGLAVSKAIVEMHGGKIWASSQGEGHGATFGIELSAAKETTDLAIGSPANGIQKQRKLRLLLVEDHRDTARTLSRLLKMNGHEVMTTGTVAEALEAAQGRSFDLIISDIGLPDASGYDLIAKLGGRSRIPAIAMSGYGMEEDLQRSRRAGFREHLVKPVAITELEQAITRVTTQDKGPSAVTQ